MVDPANIHLDDLDLKVRCREPEFVTQLQLDFLLFAYRIWCPWCIFCSVGNGFWCNSSLRKQLWVKLCQSVQLLWANLICMGNPSLLLSASESNSARLHPAAECKVPGCLVELALSFTHRSLLFREHAERRPRRASLEFSSVCRTVCVSCSCWTQSSEGCFNAAVYEHFVFEWWMGDICTLVCKSLWDAGMKGYRTATHCYIHTT